MSNLIPVSRKEQYLSKIDGMTNKSPDKTYTKEESFFSEILGEALHKPVLETRYEMYLAKIAGREIGIPYPETRLERFLAKAAGMDISVPTPITREEMYWSTYSPFYLSNASGKPPFSYNSVTGTLNNYRIYGQTIDGESVGDKTGNLFDGELYSGYYRASDGQLITDPSASNFYKYVHSNLIPCMPQTTYTLKYVCTYTNKFVIFTWYSGNNFITSTNFTNIDAHTLTLTAPLSATKFGITISGIDNDPSTQTTIAPSDISNIMLNAGSTPLPYEPYGYKVPVTVSNGTDTLTTPIYLSEQIRKVGDEAEYIDYAEQKQHFVGGTSVDVTLPALPTLTGTNVLSVGAEVQPSHVFIEFYKEREYG